MVEDGNVIYVSFLIFSGYLGELFELLVDEVVLVEESWEREVLVMFIMLNRFNFDSVRFSKEEEGVM